MARNTQRPTSLSWMPRSMAQSAAVPGADATPSWMAPRPPTRLPSRASLRPPVSAPARPPTQSLRASSPEAARDDSPTTFPKAAAVPDDVMSEEDQAARGENAALHEENSLLREEIDSLREESDALREENAGLAAHATALAQTLTTTRARVLEASEPELVRLALVIAERVVGRELSTDPGLVTEWAREALACLASRDDATLAVSSDIGEAVPPDAWTRAVGAHAVTVDPSLPPGSCVVRAGASTADASLTTRLAAVREALDGGDR